MDDPFSGLFKNPWGDKNPLAVLRFDPDTVRQLQARPEVIAKVVAAQKRMLMLVHHPDFSGNESIARDILAAAKWLEELTEQNLKFFGEALFREYFATARQGGYSHTAARAKGRVSELEQDLARAQRQLVRVRVELEELRLQKRKPENCGVLPWIANQFCYGEATKQAMAKETRLLAVALPAFVMTILTNQKERLFFLDENGKGCELPLTTAKRGLAAEERMAVAIDNATRRLIQQDVREIDEKKRQEHDLKIVAAEEAFIGVAVLEHMLLELRRLRKEIYEQRSGEERNKLTDEFSTGQLKRRQPVQDPKKIPDYARHETRRRVAQRINAFKKPGWEMIGRIFDTFEKNWRNELEEAKKLRDDPVSAKFFGQSIRRSRAIFDNKVEAHFKNKVLEMTTVDQVVGSVPAAPEPPKSRLVYMASLAEELGALEPTIQPGRILLSASMVVSAPEGARMAIRNEGLILCVTTLAEQLERVNVQHPYGPTS